MPIPGSKNITSQTIQSNLKYEWVDDEESPEYLVNARTTITHKCVDKMMKTAM